MFHITEDTPADMLAGSMELLIHLPSGKTVKMFAERSTPMMDMLVQITTNNRLQITNYVLQPLQTFSKSDQPEKVLTYYPNTPIGTLDTQHIRVVPKSRLPKIVPPPLGHQPFESTFRLKVHLPRNQLYVTRVSGNVRIENIMRKVCEEKDLDPNRYEVRHPENLVEVLDPKLTLNDYMITEIHLMLIDSKTQTYTSNDVINLDQDGGKKPLQSKTSGVFNLIFKKNKSNSGSSPFSAAIHSIFTTRNKNINKSTTTVPVLLPQNSDCDKRETLKPPRRKRRPAPKPPQIIEKRFIEDKGQETVSVETKIKPEVVGEIDQNNESNVTISHSRHSSDSSGYHETSFLSDQCYTSPSRIGRLKDGRTSKTERSHTTDSARRISITGRSHSTPSLVFTGRRKKAAPSPPAFPLKSESSSINLEKPNPVVASFTSPGFFPSGKGFTEDIPIEAFKNGEENFDENFQQKIEIRVSNAPEENLKPSKTFEEEREVFRMNEINHSKIYEKFPTDSGNSSDISEKLKIGFEEIEEIEQINDHIWHVPSPPKDFKDTETFNDNDQTDEKNTVIVPELITKLEALEEKQLGKNGKIVEDKTSSDSNCDEQPVHNKLSLEHLEKRRTLVYNRELARSLKPTGHEEKILRKYQSDLELSGKLDQFIDMLDNIRCNNMLINEKNRHSLTQSTLPNFKITTYDEPKKIVKVFEDDTIRSNSTTTLSRAQSIQKICSDSHSDFMSYKINRETNSNPHSRKFVKRAESFSSQCNSWTSNPVTRSKSQIGMKRKDESATGMSKTDTLYDISGLQSLGVMKKIQNKLNSPAISMERSKEKEIEYRKTDEDETDRKRFPHPSSINICTWSERSKIPVNNRQPTSHHHIAENVESNPTLKIKLNESVPRNTIKSTGHTLIKIGSKNDSVEGTESGFTVSRIPVVRSVELKKNLNEVRCEPTLDKPTLDHSPTDNVRRGTQFGSPVTLPLNSSQYFQEIDYAANPNSSFSNVKLQTEPEFEKKATVQNIVKTTKILDPREQLLKSIQEFGGKKGLRTRKANLN